jgi:hypothetical protein
MMNFILISVLLPDSLRLRIPKTPRWQGQRNQTIFVLFLATLLLSKTDLSDARWGIVLRLTQSSRHTF